MNSAERARTPDREVRPPRPRPVSPDPDRTSAPAAESVKPYQITEDGYFIPQLPLPNSCLTHEELSELRICYTSSETGSMMTRGRCLLLIR